MTEVLTKEELEVPRTAAEVLDWVNSAHERFTTSRELKAAFREGKLLSKELMEESFPIALFAHNYYNGSPEVVITQVIGNQKHDAVVNDQRAEPSGVSFIEITVSDSTYEDAIRMELLNRDGNVPAAGPVRAKGSRRKRKVLEADSVMVRHEDIRDEHLNRVFTVVARKGENKYPDGTALVVRVDDALPFRGREDIATLGDLAKGQLVQLVAGREFVVLALVGIRGLYLEYGL